MAEQTMFNEITEPNASPEPPQKLTFEVDPQYSEFIEQYVGEGKKYPNIGELAKAYANADRHIPELTRDLGQLKTERDSLKDLLMTNLLNENDPNNNDGTPPNNPADDGGQVKQPDASPPKSSEGNEVDIKERIREALQEVDQEKVAATNARETEGVMLQRFETKEAATKAVEERAAELGVSPQWIAQMAFTSPKAFYATMGIDANNPTQKSTNSPSSRSDVNPQRLAESNPGVKPNTYAWYQTLRKSDPNKFRSQAIQSALMKDAQENPNFYT